MQKFIVMLMLVLWAVCVQAAGIYIKNQGHFSELIIPGIADRIVSVSKGDNMVAFELSKPVASARGMIIKDPFIKSVSVNGRFLTVGLFPGNDYTINKGGGSLHVIVAKKKKDANIKMGYGIEQAVATPDMMSFENKNYDSVLTRIDKLMAERKYPLAKTVTESFLKKTGDGYYKQEATFRLGMIYLMTGRNNPNDYIYAGQLFDSFIKKYPGSFRKKDAMIKSAEAKEQAQMYNDAIFAYQNIIKSLRTPVVVKTAYKRIADIYEKMGQYKNAIDAREQVISHFKDTFADQKTKIGMLQVKTKDMDMAYSSFLDVMNSQPDLSKFTPDELFTMADVFDKKNRPDLAKPLYERVFNQYPRSQYADMSMYRSGKLLEQLKQTDAADTRFQQCARTYPKKKGGLLCSIAYAGRHLDQKSSQQWQEYLKAPLSSGDMDIRAEADMIVLRSLMADKQYDEADKKAADFINKNFDSPYLREVYKIRQSVSLMKAKNAYRLSNYNQARMITEKLLKDYPDTPYKKVAQNILQDISFGSIRAKFLAKNYKGAIDDISKYMAKNASLTNPSRWMNLLQESKFGYVKQLYGSKNYDGVIATGGEYLAAFPNGKHRNEVRLMMEASVNNIITDLYKKQNYIKLIDTFERSSDIISLSRNPAFRDRMNSYAAFALYKAGLPDRAARILDKNRNGKNPYYVMTSLMLGRNLSNVNPNVFTPGMMSMLVQELEKKNPDMLINLLRKYNKNPAYAAKEIYSISKGVFDDIKREKMLFDLYTRMESDPKARFSGYDEIYLDTGASFYKRNNYDSAVKVLEQFKKLHTKRDDTRAEGLYYLGKSYQKLGKADLATNNFMEIMESMPKSLYASAAKTELEDMKWRKNLVK